MRKRTLIMGETPGSESEDSSEAFKTETVACSVFEVGLGDKVRGADVQSSQVPFSIDR